MASSGFSALSDDHSYQVALAAAGKLEKHAKDVRMSTVNWRSYLQGQMISNEVFNFISTFDKSTPEHRERTIAANPNQFVAVFLALIEKIAKDQTLQYILTMLDDALQEDRTRVELFIQYAKRKKEVVWQPFFALLDRDDRYIVFQSARIIARIACYSQDPMDSKNLKTYMVWLRDQLKAPTNEYLQTTGRCLQMMLKLKCYRQPFIDLEGVNTIVQVLLSSPGFQIYYQLIFCLWSLTFDTQIASTINKYKVIPTIADLLTETLKEKVIRVILGTLRHLLENVEDEKLRHEHALCMVQCKVLKHLELLSEKKFGDAELTEDINFLSEKLHESVRHLSSLDEYVSEVKSGRLEWSPVHKSDRFWHENAIHLNDNNYELLKILTKLLETSRDPLILSVAAHDLGEFVRYYPRGKTTLERLGAKQQLLSFLGHEDPNVKYEALIAIQKMMVHNCVNFGEFVQGVYQQEGQGPGGENGAGGGGGFLSVSDVYKVFLWVIEERRRLAIEAKIAEMKSKSWVKVTPENPGDLLKCPGVKTLELPNSTQDVLVGETETDRGNILGILGMS